MKYFNCLVMYIITYEKLLFCFCLIFLISCNKDNKVIFETKNNEKYEVEYKKDTILISNIKNGEIVSEKYIKGNIGYFLIENNQKKLFLSTSKDTIFDNNDEFLNYKTKIKKIAKNEFETSTILINDIGSTTLTKFIYNKDYKLLKIQKSTLNEFSPK